MNTTTRPEADPDDAFFAHVSTCRACKDIAWVPAFCRIGRELFAHVTTALFRAKPTPATAPVRE